MNRIKELRKKRHLTLSELAKTLNMGPDTLRKYEAGLRCPNIATWIKLANYFDVSLDYLVCRDIVNNRNWIEPRASKKGHEIDWNKNLEVYLIDPKTGDEIDMTNAFMGDGEFESDERNEN